MKLTVVRDSVVVVVIVDSIGEAVPVRVVVTWEMKTILLWIHSFENKAGLEKICSQLLSDNIVSQMSKKITSLVRQSWQ